LDAQDAPSLTQEELSVLRCAPCSLSAVSNIASGHGYHVYGLARRGYLRRTHTLVGNQPDEDVTFYGLTALGMAVLGRHEGKLRDEQND
jgi:hypothetical protein